MTARTVLVLARSSATSERARFALVAAATAAAGGLLLAGGRIARFADPAGDGVVAVYSSPEQGLARYVTESGLRPGVVLGVLLLLVPVLALAVQALRAGSVARERRVASLRLAGASPGAVRRIAGAEAGLAALAGGLLAGPAYGLLWLVLGVLPPASARLLPAPDRVDLLAWPAVVALAALAGALAGATVGRTVVLESLAVRRRAPAGGPGRAGLVSVALGVALVLGGLSLVGLARGDSAGDLPIYAALLGVLLVALGGGPRFVRVLGRRSARRGDAEALLAGRRLEVDATSAGRVAGVLAVCGLSLGIDALLVVDALTSPGTRDDLAFYLTGSGLAALGVLLAAAVAVLTLFVGAADQLLDARRPLATLAALGVEAGSLERVLRRQLSIAAVPAVMLGVLAGGSVAALAEGETAAGVLASVALPTVLTAAAAGAVVALAARATARLLRGRIRAATEPENLRVA